VQTLISLSILGYEKDLRNQRDEDAQSKVVNKITSLIDSGLICNLHIDVMRPSLIPDKIAFPMETIKRIYDNYNKKISFELHLMVANPILCINKMNDFIQPNIMSQTLVIIQYEAYLQEDKVINALQTLHALGYKAGIGLDLPTPVEKLTKEIVDKSDLVFLMAVPMGKGGQKYDQSATEKIRHVSKAFPRKVIEVDGGLNDKTIKYAKDAGTKILVIGSYITNNIEPLDVLDKISKILEG
jgi:ribulose-phosphate 3-epimerase